MIKYALEFDAKKPHEFIESVRDLICLQYQNEERTVLRKDPYRITLREKCPYSELFWSAFSGIQSECGKMRPRITPKADTFYTM